MHLRQLRFSASHGALSLFLAAVGAWAHPGLDHDISRVSQAIAESPNRADLWLERARLYRLHGDFPASLADLDHVTAVGAERFVIHLERGLTLAAMNEDEAAFAELDRYIADGGEAASAFAARGHIHTRAGLFGAAIRDFTAALSRNPEVDLYLARGRLQESAGQLDDAACGYREGLARLNGAFLIRLALIRVESARNRLDEALALIDEGRRGAMVQTEWCLRRAEALSAAGRKHEADQELDRALIESDRALTRHATPLNRYLKAKVYVAMGRRADAIVALEKVLRVAPSFSKAAALLASLREAPQKEEHPCE